MWLLCALLLRFLHFIHAAVIVTKCFWAQHSRSAPKPLSASRRRIPKHLAVVFAVDPSLSDEITREVLTESVVDVVTWCQTIGVRKLTVYEEKDLLFRCARRIRERLPRGNSEDYSSESETEYPITPPPSDYPESRPLSPDSSKAKASSIATICVEGSLPHSDSKVSRRKQLRHRQDSDLPKCDVLLCFASRESSKPAIAFAAQNIARKQFRQFHRRGPERRGKPLEISVSELEYVLEDDEGLSAPDFMIVHRVEPANYVSRPLELHGFPPWHIRLTEIYHNKPQKSLLQKWLSPHWPEAFPLDETSFRASLDEFASAEMRFGK